MVVAAVTIAAADRCALALKAVLAARAGMTATATVFMVTLGIDTLTIAVGLGIGARTLTVAAFDSCGTGMTTSPTVLRIGLNDGASVTTTHVSNEAAIPGSAFLDLLAEAEMRAVLTAEARTHPTLGHILGPAQ
jgi:hypothetical protein